MKNKINLSILMLILILSVFFVSAQESKITIPFTIIDENKNFFSGLQATDIQIKQGKKILAADSFQQFINQNLDVVLMIDASSSQLEVLPVVKVLAQRFIDLKLKKGKDRVAVIRFTDEAKIYHPLNDDFAAANQNIARIEPSSRQPIVIVDNIVGPGGIPVNNSSKTVASVDKKAQTSIYDSVKDVSKNFFQNERKDTRKVIILITDGFDTFSENTMKEAVEAALKSKILIYAIGIGSFDVEKEPLKKITTSTGGKAFFPNKKDDLTLVFGEIDQSLRSNYALTFNESELQLTDQSPEIKVEIINPELSKRKLSIFKTQIHFKK